MKTITEFSGFTLKDALQKKTALLAEGKTEEEAQTAINEQLKLLDDTKVTFFKNAIDMSKSRLDQVKRVVIAVKSSETEKVPESFSEREGNFYLVEFFSTSAASHRGSRDEQSPRGRDGGRGRNDRGRGDRGDRNDRGDRSRGDRPDRGQPRPERAAGGGEFKKPKEGAIAAPAERKPRPPKGPKPAGARPPRPAKVNAQQGPKGAAELRLVLKGQSASTLQGSGAATQAAGETTGSETQQA